MSGSLIGGIAGAALGFFVPVIGPALGFALGSTAGSLLFPGSLPTQYGPRLEDLRPQTSEYGKPIPIVYATLAMGGNVIWASDYVEVETKTEQGGKGGPSQTSVTYSYYANFAVAFAEGPNTIGRMWAGPSKRLIYDGVLLEGGGTVRIYEGTEDQLPDPLIESYEGVGNVPAHRGVTYVVFEMFPLSEDGNAIPFITAEVGAKAGPHGQTPVLVSDGTIPNDIFDQTIAEVSPTNGWVWIAERTSTETTFSVQVVNDAKQEIIKSWNLDISSLAPHGGDCVGIAVNDAYAYVLVVPWINDSRRPIVARFFAGEASLDGTVKTAPELEGLFFYGMPSGGGVAEYPRDAQAIFATNTTVWISYGKTTAPITLAAFPVADQTPELNQASFTQIATGMQIGYPFHIAGDDEFIGVAGWGGGSGSGNKNFLVIDAALKTVQHDVLWLIEGHQGKAFDFDPKRKQFVAYIGSNPGSVTVLDAMTGVASQKLLSTANSDTTPAPATVPTAVTYSSRMDRYLVGASLGPTATSVGSTVYIINPDTLDTEFAATFEPGAQIVTPLLDPPLNSSGAPYVLAFGPDNLKRLSLGGVAQARPMNLGAIVADLSLRAGLSADQIDVSQLTDMVDGYAIARQTTVRAAIDALRPAYYFDAVESGGKVKFVKRGGSAVAVISDNDLDAHQADGQPGDPLLTTRQMEVELPKTVNVSYLLAATDYEKATQTYSRQVGSSEEETTLDLPLVLTDTKGQEIAQVNTHAAWVQRIKYGPFSLPRKYSYLEPTDIITIRGYEMMLEKVTASPGGVLTCEAVATDSSSYTPHVVVTETVPTEKIVYVPGETVLELM